jgi:hypothetical protein
LHLLLLLLWMRVEVAQAQWLSWPAAACRCCLEQAVLLGQEKQQQLLLLLLVAEQVHS